METISIMLIALRILEEKAKYINMDVLGEEVIYENNGFRRVRRWLRGIHPEQGIIVRGLTGWETLVEKDIFKVRRVEVIDLTPSLVTFHEIEGQL